MKVLKMMDVDLSGKRVLIRQDLNVPIINREISNDTRIRVSLPTIQQALKQGAGVIVLSHLGRPIEGEFDREHSLKPVQERLSELLDQEVLLIKEWLYGVDVAPGQVVLCENVRFNVGEKANSPELSQKIASLCDVFVMDAFATAHRAEASTAGVSQYAPVACAGPLLVKELEALEVAVESPKAPVVAIVGGAKVSTKLKVLNALVNKVDTLIVGGGIANTFIAAQGVDVGKSLYEPELVEDAEALLQGEHRADIPMPQDVVVADELSEQAEAYVRGVDQIEVFEKVFDIGPETIALYTKILESAGTILWNGPVGVFEFEQFCAGTRAVAHAIAKSQAFSIAGGGDTIAAIDQMGVAEEISYISTGGGAFLAILEGKPLPAVEALKQRASK